MDKTLKRQRNCQWLLLLSLDFCSRISLDMCDDCLLFDGLETVGFVADWLTVYCWLLIVDYFCSIFLGWLNVLVRWYVWVLFRRSNTATATANNKQTEREREEKNRHTYSSNIVGIWKIQFELKTISYEQKKESRLIRNDTIWKRIRK